MGEKAEGTYKDKEVERSIKSSSWRPRYFSCLSRGKEEITRVRRWWWW